MANSTPVTLAEAAEWYCRHGFAVFPLWPKSKKPATIHGLNDWSDNPESAREYWAEHPDANIGIACGVPSHGLVVLDFDEDDAEGVHGLDTLNDWEETRGELPSTVVAVTGRGGYHMLYRTDRSGIRPSANRDLGVDVRCDGGYIVAPPSIHPNGSIYRWQDGCAPWEVDVATADGNVYDLLDHVQRNGGSEDGQRPREAFKLPDRIKQGERDDTLMRYGFSLRGKGYPDDAILAMLEKANTDRCEKPLTAGEIKRIATSVCKKGPGHDGEGEFIGEGEKVGAFGNKADGVPNFRTKRGKIQTNMLARTIMKLNHARHIDGALAVWTGRRWEFGKDAVSRLAIEYADDIKVQERNEVYGYLHARAPFVESDKDFDGRHYVQFANCTWDVMAEEVVEPAPSMFITAEVAVDLDIEAAPNAADAFLESISGGDDEVEAVLCEIIGACMCSRRVLSQSPMLIGRAGAAGGDAANGKSTFLNMLRALLGSGNVSSLDIATLGQRFQAGRIVGKLANLGDDIPDGFLRGDELSLFKKLVTGDSIYSDVKNADGFEFRPSATFVFSMNAMPRLADTTDGVFRRLAFVPFRRKFIPGMPEYDPDIIAKITTDECLRRFALLGLFKLEGLIERGELTRIADMVEEVEAVRIDNDIVRRWMFEEGIDPKSLADRWTFEVYGEFKRWADGTGERYTVSQASFTKKVVAVPLGTACELIVVRTNDKKNNIHGRKFKLKSKVEG